MKIILICLLLISFLSASEPAWPFADGYDDNMLYLHALVNYDYSTKWIYEWEKNQFSDNCFRITVGSVTTSDLLTEASVLINHDIGAGWRFQGMGRRYETRHENAFDNYAFMGLEKQISGGFNIHLLVNPGYYKEETDIHTGIAFYSEDKESFLRLSLLIEDFVYDAKNDMSGVTVRSPRGLSWAARKTKLPFVIYSQGRLSIGYQRSFTDMNKSNGLSNESEQKQNALIKLYFLPRENVMAAVGVRYYQFSEEVRYFSGENDYCYDNNLSEISADYITEFSAGHRIRLLARYITQTAAGYGYRAHDYLRRELLFGSFYEYVLGSHAIETGYMFSVYDLRYSDYTDRSDFADNGFVDKLKLGWIYRFPNQAIINISVSHQLVLGGFGGANLQYIMFF